MKKENLSRIFLRVMCITLTVIMCLALGACGEKSTSSEITIGDNEEYEGIDATVGGDTVSKTTSTSSKKGGKTDKGGTSTNPDLDWMASIPKKYQGKSVTFAVWGDENATEYAKVIKLFTKKTKINVKWVTYNEEKYVSTIVTQNAVGKGPDIVINNMTFPTSVEAVQELPAIFNVNDGFWDPRVTEQLSYKGKKYFVNSYKSPIPTGGAFVFYNKQIFSNNNITSPQDYVDQGNWTFESLLKCYRDAHAKGFDGGSFQPHVVWTATGAGLINYDPKTGTFSNGLNDASQRSDIISSLKNCTTMLKEGITTNSAVNRFSTGNMAIIIQTNFGFKYNGWFKGMTPSSLGVVEMPSTFNGKKANCYGGSQRAYGIGKNASAESAEMAYYVLRFFLDIDNYADANADIFLNKNLERFYKDTYLPHYKSGTLKIEYMTTPLNLVGSPWSSTSSGTWKDLFDKNAVPEEIETDLMSRKNIVDNACATANEKIQSAAK